MTALAFIVRGLCAACQVLSPMGGTYYRSPAPGEPPFIREGDKVKKGQTICIIEAMKLMNEIEVQCRLTSSMEAKLWAT